MCIIAACVSFWFIFNNALWVSAAAAELEDVTAMLGSTVVQNWQSVVIGLVLKLHLLQSST